VACAILMAVATPLSLYQTARADKFDDQIRAIQREIDQFNAQAAELNKQASSLQNEVNRLSTEKAIIQAQIDISQTKYDKLVVDIAVSEQRISDNKDALGITIANLYVDEAITPLEMLASSKNIGDYVDKQTYQTTIRDNLTNTIEVIKKLKRELEHQKVEAERTLADQKSQREALASKEAEQQQLLDKTKSDENAYRQLSANRDSQVQKLREQQRLAFEALRQPGGGFANSSPTGYAITYKNWSGNSYCGGGYDYCQYGHDDSVSDPWGLGLARECVHYVADALQNRGYYIPYNAFSPYNGYGGGNANKWIPVSTGENFAQLVGDPQPGDVAYMAVPGVGHVGMVEENYGNGWIRISQYNFGFNGQYSTMDLKITSSTQFLRFNR